MGKKNNFQALTLKEFLMQYYGIECENLDKITHNELKEIIPEIKRYPMRLVDKNRQKIYDGEIIMVKDKNNVTLAYVNPMRGNNPLVIEDIYLLEIDVESKTHKEIDIDALDKKSLYELRELLKDAKKMKKSKEFRIIKKQIEIKSEGIRKNTKHEKLEKVLIREKEEYLLEGW